MSVRLTMTPMFEFSFHIRGFDHMKHFKVTGMCNPYIYINNIMLIKITYPYIVRIVLVIIYDTSYIVN